MAPNVCLCKTENKLKRELFTSIRLSVSNDLKVDAERDLRDIGAHKIDVYSLNKVRNTHLSCCGNCLLLNLRITLQTQSHPSWA